jgi:glycolate oxidase iron-sulfur subunit
MRTSFTPAQLADPATAVAEAAIRKCVHCGFCLATCPTYVLLGDELDSPRGRIYLMQDMLENRRTPAPEVVKHIDRCLSCLSCMTTCPSGVNYQHLVDHARAYIEANYRRPWRERLVRELLAAVLPYPKRFRAALALARLVKPLAPLMGPLRPMLELAPDHVPPLASKASAPGVKGRVLMLQGCAEPVLAPQVRAATVRLLNRAGYEVVFAEGEGCCGGLVHHMGRKDDALAAARRNVDAWSGRDLAAIVTATSGCGVTLKDYGFLLRDDPAYADRAAAVSALAMDISQFLDRIDLPAGRGGLTVAYHGACSLQHGQQVRDEPVRLLKAAGFAVKTPAGAHLCCGSAGTYNLLQPEIAGQLGMRKAASLDALDADVIATGNIGCSVQIGRRAGTPVVHLVELLDWATGGAKPPGLPSPLAGEGGPEGVA